MALSSLDDKTKTPDENALTDVLGRSKASWNALIEFTKSQCQPFNQQWFFAGEKWGWSLRLQHKKRNIIYLTPGNKQFFIGMVLGDKAIARTCEIELPSAVRSIIDEAPKYGEGTGFRIPVKVRKDLAPVFDLIKIKRDN